MRVDQDGSAAELRELRSHLGGAPEAIPGLTSMLRRRGGGLRADKSCRLEDDTDDAANVTDTSQQ